MYVPVFLIALVLTLFVKSIYAREIKTRMTKYENNCQCIEFGVRDNL
jgi:hypothetical protein